jgi:hypothetical protein
MTIQAQESVTSTNLHSLNNSYRDGIVDETRLIRSCSGLSTY